MLANPKYECSCRHCKKQTHWPHLATIGYPRHSLYARYMAVGQQTTMWSHHLPSTRGYSLNNHRWQARRVQHWTSQWQSLRSDAQWTDTAAMGNHVSHTRSFDCDRIWPIVARSDPKYILCRFQTMLLPVVYRRLPWPKYILLGNSMNFVHSYFFFTLIRLTQPLCLMSAASRSGLPSSSSSSSDDSESELFSFFDSCFQIRKRRQLDMKPTSHDGC